MCLLTKWCRKCVLMRMLQLVTACSINRGEKRVRITRGGGGGAPTIGNIPTLHRIVIESCRYKMDQEGLTAGLLLQLPAKWHNKLRQTFVPGITHCCITAAYALFYGLTNTCLTGLSLGSTNLKKQIACIFTCMMFANVQFDCFARPCPIWLPSLVTRSVSLRIQRRHSL
jgi:hypothetical protein